MTELRERLIAAGLAAIGIREDELSWQYESDTTVERIVDAVLADLAKTHWLAPIAESTDALLELARDRGWRVNVGRAQGTEFAASVGRVGDRVEVFSCLGDTPYAALRAAMDAALRAERT